MHNPVNAYMASNCSFSLIFVTTLIKTTLAKESVKVKTMILQIIVLRFSNLYCLRMFLGRCC